MTNELRPTVIRAEARKVLAGKWNAGALVALVYMLIVGVICALREVSPAAYGIAYLAVIPVLSTGLMWVFLSTARGAKPAIGGLFEPFRCYVRIFIAQLLLMICVMIGMILLIVPGIIVGIGLTMTLYIMRDDAQISPVGAMKRSWVMMNGHKMEMFLLALSFLGWAILASITVIGILWFVPYMSTAMARFYDKIKAGQPEAA